jgi:DNA recombination protein RmuC
MKTMREIRLRGEADTAAAERIHELESHLSQLLKSQGEMTGRMQTMAEVFGSRQSDMMRAVNERLDGMGHKLEPFHGRYEQAHPGRTAASA